MGHAAIECGRTAAGPAGAHVTFYSLRSTPAFTLPELLVTIAIAALLASVATVSLVGTYRATRAEDVAGQVTAYDRLAREGCRRSGRAGWITFDLTRGRVSRSFAEGADDERADQPSALRLPSGFRIDRVILPTGAHPAGEVAIPCSTRGQTTSYAVAIADRAGRRRWVVVAGLTGAWTAVEREADVEHLMRSLTPLP